MGRRKTPLVARQNRLDSRGLGRIGSIGQGEVGKHYSLESLLLFSLSFRPIRFGDAQLMGDHSRDAGVPLPGGVRPPSGRQRPRGSRGRQPTRRRNDELVRELERLLRSAPPENGNQARDLVISFVTTFGGSFEGGALEIPSVGAGSNALSGAAAVAAMVQQLEQEQYGDAAVSLMSTGIAAAGLANFILALETSAIIWSVGSSAIIFASQLGPITWAAACAVGVLSIPGELADVHTRKWYVADVAGTLTAWVFNTRLEGDESPHGFLLRLVDSYSSNEEGESGLDPEMLRRMRRAELGGPPQAARDALRRGRREAERVWRNNVYPLHNTGARNTEWIRAQRRLSDNDPERYCRTLGRLFLAISTRDLARGGAIDQAQQRAVANQSENLIDLIVDRFQ